MEMFPFLPSLYSACPFQSLAPKDPANPPINLGRCTLGFRRGPFLNISHTDKRWNKTSKFVTMSTIALAAGVAIVTNPRHAALQAQIVT